LPHLGEIKNETAIPYAAANTVMSATANGNVKSVRLCRIQRRLDVLASQTASNECWLELQAPFQICAESV
jgi:hypothetical protein